MRFFRPIPLGLTCVVAAVAVVLGAASAGPPTVPGANGDDPAADRVATLLYAQQAAWNARARSQARKEVVEALQDDLLHRALLRIVAAEEHPMRLQAIQATGAITSELARPLLERIWRRAPVEQRVAAFDALDRLHPWKEEQILGQLNSGKGANIRAILTVALRRSVLSGEQIADLLSHEAPEVVALAVRAYPTTPDHHDALALLERLDDLNTRGEAEEIFKRVRLSDSVEILVTSWIDVAPHLRRVILGVLARLGRPLKKADRVIALAIGGEAEHAEEEIAALSCLELTGTPCELEQIRKSLGFKDPVYMYHAARLLLSRGHKLGYQVLLKALGEDRWESDGIHPSLARLLKTECWRLLAEHLEMPERELRERRQELLDTGVARAASGLGPSSVDLSDLGEFGSSAPR